MIFMTPMLPFSAPARNRLLRRQHDVNVSQLRFENVTYLAVGARNARHRLNKGRCHRLAQSSTEKNGFFDG